MKILYSLLLSILVISLSSCNEYPKDKLGVVDFANKIKEYPNAQIIDVRTPEEFSKGHLINAVNIDYHSNDFNKQLDAFDKQQPVFVYCLSGSRSSSAGKKMHKSGFEKVYQLDGGIIKWRAADMPETTGYLEKKTILEQLK
ncbi:MAG: rhodanese-like domain-containing protein [Chitinophagales bacterium]